MRTMTELGNEKTMIGALIVHYSRNYWAVINDDRTGETLEKMTFPKSKGIEEVTAIVRGKVRAYGKR